MKLRLRDHYVTAQKIADHVDRAMSGLLRFFDGGRIGARTSRSKNQDNDADSLDRSVRQGRRELSAFRPSRGIIRYASSRMRGSARSIVGIE